MIKHATSNQGHAFTLIRVSLLPILVNNFVPIMAQSDTHIIHLITLGVLITDITYLNIVPHDFINLYETIRAYNYQTHKNRFFLILTYL